MRQLREVDEQWQTDGHSNEDMIRMLHSVVKDLSRYISWFHSSAFMGDPWTFERYLQHMMGRFFDLSASNSPPY